VDLAGQLSNLCTPLKQLLTRWEKRQLARRFGLSGSKPPSPRPRQRRLSAAETDQLIDAYRTGGERWPVGWLDGVRRNRHIPAAAVLASGRKVNAEHLQGCDTIPVMLCN
jgi:hypothetical protein